MTTEECLLDQRRQVRNPGLAKDEVETVLKRALGVRSVIWLGRGIAGDDTHGHVDDVCRFVNARTIVYCAEQNTGDVNYAALKDNEARLRGSVFPTARGPGWLLAHAGASLHGPLRLPASYANFYSANDTVLVTAVQRSERSFCVGDLPNCSQDASGRHSCVDWCAGSAHS